MGCTRNDCHPEFGLSPSVIQEAITRHRYREDPEDYWQRMRTLRDARNGLEVLRLREAGLIVLCDDDGM